eukprot:CAMPEP_0170467260 /NCGR_PEP_ID=MMETSP0123-20130129/10902_1 /TAXON_ID=182087 /ORGANISM="Favella ehrenbergii, Strain Fehren 1" /LENGTH=109 /DNA_ID=CAMNT_0010733575 /DNA_START=937 /DNA_END=1266 /DNA_ORIENTATION=+
MDKFAPLVESAHDKYCLLVAHVPIGEVGVTQTWRCVTVLAHELHHDDVVLQDVRIWHFDEPIGDSDSFQVSDFFLGPEFDHFAGIALAMTVAEAEFATNVALAVLENQD